MSAVKAERYAAYKDSGVEWLGAVPAHWTVKRLKELVFIQNSNVDKKSYEGETSVRLCNYVDVYKNELITKQLSQDFMFATANASEIMKFGIRKNDVLITKDSETANDIAVPALAKETLDGVVCGYHLAQIRTDSKQFLGPYLFRLFQSKDYGSRFETTAKGITRVGLGQAAIADAMTPVPTLPEQTAIAAYLDTKTAQIDRQIDLLSQKATQYGKLKQSLINETVTRGLDKTVPMKDSGVEWIGEVPEHWEVKRLKELGYLYSGLSGKSGGDFTDDNINSAPFIPFTNIANNFYLSVKELKHVVILPDEKQNTIRKNDLFFLMSSEDFSDLGKSSLLLKSPVLPIYLNSFCKGFRFVKKYVDPRFINYLLHSSEYRTAVSNEGRGFTRINLRMNKINDITLCLPPLPEQTAITTYLDTKTAQIDRIVATINQQIDKLKDLRKALINDVVTGKIKVVSEGAAV